LNNYKLCEIQTPPEPPTTTLFHRSKKRRPGQSIRAFYFLENSMKYPNLRYGDPAALAFYTQFYPDKERVRMLARQLRRSERSVRDWLSGAEKMPWWVPEIVRLQRLEHVEMMRQMNMQPARPQLGVVAGTVLEFKRPADPVPPAVPMLRGSKLLIC
jgi:hypothetical protein